MTADSQDIISLANSMFAPRSLGPQQSQGRKDDRLDAARALLGVSPSSVSKKNDSFSLFGGNLPLKPQEDSPKSETEAPRRPRSNSAGLEALAFLATTEQATMSENVRMESTRRVAPLLDESRVLIAASAVSSSSSDDDSEAMPPPPPRIVTRPRSVSNPEGMEKWTPRNNNRMHFVLPASILEEELAEASAAMKAKEANESPHSTDRESDSDEQEDDEEEEEEILDQDELLRRARSRLLEDLSEVNLNGEKGVLTLPHSLAKYKEVYNKNGRIGIYTQAERAAIISRYQSKRQRRVWNKKIRYNCRKNLADRRMRVKGRFVKRSTEQEARALANSVPPIPETEAAQFVTPDSSTAGDSMDVSRDDEVMPDVSDPDAGFCPTDDQPFRRVRRHTIT